MISYFERDSVDIMFYNKYYNPKIKNKYLEKSILYYTDNDKENDDDFISKYDEWDYDTINDLD
jgi:hypothetical protein